MITLKDKNAIVNLPTRKDNLTFGLFGEEFVSHNNIKGIYVSGYTSYDCGGYIITYSHKSGRISVRDTHLLRHPHPEDGAALIQRHPGTVSAKVLINYLI